MTDDRKVPDRPTGHAAKMMIQRIADMLNVPTAVFGQPHPSPMDVRSSDAQREELLCLFSALQNPSDRQRVIDFARMQARRAE